MAQPRLKCLNATAQIAKKAIGLRAPFSSFSAARADDAPPARSSAAADLLEGILDSRPRTRFAEPYPGKLPLTRETYSSVRLPTSNKQRGKQAVASAISGALAQSQQMRRGRGGPEPALGTADAVANHSLAQDLSRQISRRWKAGDIYAPKDLSPVEMAKWKNRGKPERDVFDVLQFDPLEHYKNFSIMSEYMTPMGRIKHSKETGLRPVNQRKIARAIRRSIGMGMMPSVHRHPELLHKQLEGSRNQQLSALRRGPGI